MSTLLQNELAVAVLSLLFATASLIVSIVIQRRDVRRKRWLRGNLTIMRVHVSRVSPEGVAVINCLERAEHTLSAVDGESLENYLHTLKRAREAGILEAVTTSRGNGKGGAS